MLVKKSMLVKNFLYVNENFDKKILMYVGEV